MKGYVIIIAAFATIVIALALLYVVMGSRERYEDSPPKVRVILIHAEWCGHCKTYLSSGKFDSIAKEMMQKYPGVSFEKYDEAKNANVVSKYNVKGFPTILAENAKGEVFPLQGSRDDPKAFEALIKQAM